ncbi:3-oxo-tetronate kinase [Roseitranquillus sediminis]|uniref:3-oxo-tetronate kinase n=1 Tax=Roseitranquillus sediminis TaxID=2809051 RepID=UPI001D0C1B79|nr:3-oxo-tetronate kinase [Roseitranquillus sediminis]MBM9595424.1 four-carbon acid sugar kinase family protein [Roseitranquillus sediminis]
MLIGVIADDFTGASDIANTLTRGLPGQGGLRTSQFIGIPSGPAPQDVEAGVISLKSRSIPVAEAVSLSLEALDWLLSQGAEQIVFKYCSTFDSTPEGNIGPVAEALADRLGVRGVIVCPAFPATGRSIHQGHLFVGDRLLSESGMEDHPLTPMTDPDIRRWLGRQCATPVGLVAAPVVRKGSEAIAAALAEAAERVETLVVADAATDDDLVTLGRAARGARLITGGSGIALGLPASFIEVGRATGGAPELPTVAGRAVILSGSCSRATRAQIETHLATGAPALEVSVDDAVAGDITAEDVVDFALGHADALPLVYSSASPEVVRAAQERHGREVASDALERLFAEAARRLVEAGFSRIVVAGGETSGAVAQAIAPSALRIGPEIDAGVPVLVSNDPEVALALKSGNFGGPDFFARAARRLAGDAS